MLFVKLKLNVGILIFDKSNKSDDLVQNNILTIIRDYAFYSNILNKKYNHNRQNKYLFTVLIDHIDKNQKSDLIDIFKISILFIKKIEK